MGYPGKAGYISILLVDNAIELFIAFLRDQKGYSEHTIRNYLNDLGQFSEFLFSIGCSTHTEGAGDCEIEAVDPLIIRKYVGSLYGRLKRTSIARKLSSLRSFFLFLEKQGFTKGNPAADIATPKLEKYVPTYLPVDDVFRLFERPDRKMPLGLRHLALL